MATNLAAPPSKRHSGRRAPPPPAAPTTTKAGSGAATNDTGAAVNGAGAVANGGGERTVKKLRLSKALTISEGTLVSEACRRMAHRRVDAVLLTDSHGLLSGIATDKDISARVIAEGLRPEQTTVAKIMTRSPQYVMADTLAIEALQKMIQGKFRHLPVVENGEVIAMLDIAKCLYDAISRMEKAAEQGNALAAAVEGVEKQFGNNFSAPYDFIETLRERMFKPSISTILTENGKVAFVSHSDPVSVAAKKMKELRVTCVIIASGSKIQGILTSKDILMRVVAKNLPPELTSVEKVMTANPECVTVETPILDALHTMHDGKFLHLPVIDKDEHVVACLDVLQLSHAAISLVEGGNGTVNDMANTMMQKFWDSALSLEPADDDFDTHSSASGFPASESTETGKYMYPPLVGNSFSFKFEDKKGRVHRFNCGTESLAELVSAVMQRVGLGGENDKIQLLYDDDEGDKVLLTSDGDLIAAVNSAKLAGLRVLRLHFDESESKKKPRDTTADPVTVERVGWTSRHSGILAGTLVLAGIVAVVYLKRSKV